MEAIEFEANVENGKITIPNKYMDNLPQKIRVILLVEQEKKDKQKKKEFKAFKVKSDGFKFDRDEANER